MNSSVQNTAKFSAPSIITRQIQSRPGRRRTASNSSSPAGSARSAASVIGWPCGRNSVVTK